MFLNKLFVLALTLLTNKALAQNGDDQVILSIGADHGAGYYDENNTLHDGPTHSTAIKWPKDDVGKSGVERTRQVIIYKDERSKVVRYNLTCTGKPLLYVKDSYADYTFTNKVEGDKVIPEVHNAEIASLVCKEGDVVRFDSNEYID